MPYNSDVRSRMDRPSKRLFKQIWLKGYSDFEKGTSQGGDTLAIYIKRSSRS